MKKPLLRMLWCESVAPFGKPVVPHVYWMLIGSSKSSSGHSTSSAASRSSSCDLVAEEDDVLEVGQVVADLVHHRAVIQVLNSGAATARQPDWRSAYSSSVVR